MKNLTVECYSGARYAEKPQAFTWQGQRLPVEEVLQTYRTPDGLRFRVLTTDQQVYELIYVQSNDEWEIQPG